MDFFEKMNKKLDEGYKLTDTNCPQCNKSIMYDPKEKTLYCIGCMMPVKLESEIIQ